ncbi:peroxiredoxin family protein [Aquirufa sp. ROCK-SH2]
MKKSLSILFVLLLSTFVLTAQNYQIKVKVGQVIPNKKIYLELINARGQAIKIDSVLPNAQNAALFTGKIVDQGGFYLLNFYDVPNPQKVLLILEGNETVEVTADGINTPEKQGNFSIQSKSENIKYMLQLMAISKELEGKVKIWNEEIKKNPSSSSRIQTEFATAQQSTLQKIKSLVPQMGSNLVALWATNFLPQDTEMATLEEIGNRFRQSRPNHPQVKPFLENLKRLKGANQGSEAPEIALPTPTGEILALSSLKGKYVLIDFWASWCGPCRQENPNVVKTYAKYKDKGFEIFGVSLDKDKAAWLRAIENDKLVWKHVSDLQYWNSVGAQAYGVNSIPMTFLLDPTGKIVAKGLRGPALEQYLANIFKDK